MAIENLNNFQNNAVLLINQNETNIAAAQTNITTLQGYYSTMTAGTGITGGTGTIHEASAQNHNGVFVTRILMDMTGLRSTAADDIIGVDGTANPCYIGQITAAANGTILGGKVTCLEVPAGGDPDIDLYSATEGTGVEDGAIADLTETQLLNSGDWLAVGDVKFLSATPAANEYLYLVAGATTDADYTAGRFLIELYGYA